MALSCSAKPCLLCSLLQACAVSVNVVVLSLDHWGQSESFTAAMQKVGSHAHTSHANKVIVHLPFPSTGQYLAHCPLCFYFVPPYLTKTLKP